MSHRLMSWSGGSGGWVGQVGRSGRSDRQDRQAGLRLDQQQDRTEPHHPTATGNNHQQQEGRGGRQPHTARDVYGNQSDGCVVCCVGGGCFGLGVPCRDFFGGLQGGIYLVGNLFWRLVMLVQVFWWLVQGWVLLGVLAGVLMLLMFLWRGDARENPPGGGW